MEDELMAGSPQARKMADERDAECLRLLASYIGGKAAERAMNDESYLSVVLPVLQSDGEDREAVRRLQAAFALEPKRSMATTALG